MSHSVIVGDVSSVLPALEACSFDAVFCDPPFGISFMGAAWDHGVPSAEVWREVMRTLRPGAPLLAFGGSRTDHRLACAIEDAGFCLIDKILWIHGQGFPKGNNISKSIDRGRAHRKAEHRVPGKSGFSYRGGADDFAPSSDASKSFIGYNTQLKPAYESVCLAQKPNDGTYAQNALRHGVAGINVGACRVGKGSDKTPSPKRRVSSMPAFTTASATNVGGDDRVGRYPANIVLDDDAAAAMDEQSGDNVSRFFWKFARFKYTAKASKRERSLGLPPGEVNVHACVKPIDLCRYLATLILPPNTSRPRRLLVPFSGSGSEMIGAMIAGWDEIVGIEMSAEYAAIAEARIAHWAAESSTSPSTRRLSLEAAP